MEDEHRERKKAEEKLRSIQIKNRLRRESQSPSKADTKEVQRLLTSIRGIKEGENLFEQMHERGEPLTFSDEGMPIIQKGKAVKANLIQSSEFCVPESVTVEKKNFQRQKATLHVTGANERDFEKKDSISGSSKLVEQITSNIESVIEAQYA